MLSASSPLRYPPSSSPGPKRDNPQPTTKPARKRTRGGFLVDDDDDSDQELASSPKRLQRSSPTQHDATDATQPSSPPAQSGLVLPDTSKTDKLSGSGREHSSRAASFLFGKPETTSIFDSLLPRPAQKNTYKVKTCSGKTVAINQRRVDNAVSYERMVAARSKTKEGRAARAYYGIDIHELVASASKQIRETAEAKTVSEPEPHQPVPSIEQPQGKKPKMSLLWTEKYRAKNFMDLVGDDGTNRQVLRWLKRWDPVVFPGASKPKAAVRRPGAKVETEEEKPHRKILMLTGPPGLGKTTLAHVCARQAGYEVLEINASDDRSRDVVKNQIRTSLGTENVKTVQHRKNHAGQPTKVAKPVCVVVDEVDGVVSGSGGSGEGGFIKALMDLITTSEKNMAGGGEATQGNSHRKRKGDDFKQMRPLVLICNDVYHSSLRPLRQSNLAEVIHVGKPTIDAVVTRLKSVFEKEGIPCEKDAARKICEAAWGMSSGMDAKRGAESTAEGDLRGIMVVGEWVAGRLRSHTLDNSLCLTRQWVERNVVRDLAHGGGGARGIGRGNVKDIVTRIFQEGAGFPKSNILVTHATSHSNEQPQAQLGFSEQQKKYAMERLRHMIETSGDVDRVVTDIFSDYPNHEFNDDSFLTKPDQAYDWMHFHDTCSSKLFGSQEWELAPYLSQPILACHHLFASPIRLSNRGYDRKWGGTEDDEAVPLPFSGPRADFVAHEAQKENRAMLQTIQSQLPPTLMRAFRSAEDISTDLMPYLIRLISPDVKPVVVGGSGDQRGTASVRKESEKLMVKRAAEALLDVGVALQRGKIEGDNNASRGPQWVYRMEPDLDMLSTFETSAAVVNGTQGPTRYAVRQVLDQEMHKMRILRDQTARQARFRSGNTLDQEDFVFDDKENEAAIKEAAATAVSVKKDFFGRVIKMETRVLQETDGNTASKKRSGEGLGKAETKVWVTFHEGLNNAVRKPISLDELLRGL